MIIFDQTQVGMAGCFSVQATGTAPASLISFGDPWFPKTINPLPAAERALRRGFNDLQNMWAEFADEPKINENGLQTEYDYGDFITGGRSESQSDNYDRATKSLTKAIFPMGLVTGLSLDYADTYSNEGPVLTSKSPALLLGTGTVIGVVFDSKCDGSGSKDGHHGLEGILDYYYNNRVSNGAKNLSMANLNIGKTSIATWVVGLTVQPQNFDYRIWQWTLKLAITPQFKNGMLSR